MNKKIKNILILICLIAVLILPYFAFAQDDPLKRLQGVATEGGFTAANETSLASIAGKVVNAFFSLLGVIFLTLMLYAGYMWMIASGDESKLEKAKNTIRRAIIGLIITVGSWAIYNFIFVKLFQVAN